jgi:hypothetical protein
MQTNEDTRELSALTAEFGKLAAELLANCEQKGAPMRPFYTLRGPGVQARLWCQSRSAVQIQAQAAALRKAGAPWLASLLDVKFSMSGPAVTNALPGLSWHQWGEAVDCFAVGVTGAAIWDPKHSSYRIYAEEAKNLGLEAGGLWTRFPDAVHVQWRKAPSPLSAGLSWISIEEEMARRFGGTA